MKHVLVVGASGFVGQHMLSRLAATPQACRVTGMGREAPAALPEGVDFEPVDICDGEALSALVARHRPTHVLHLAAMSSVQQSLDAPGQTWRVNLVGLLNLAEAVARHASDAAFVFVSSGEVYGSAFLSGTALAEDVEPKPLGSYARSKWFGEEVLRDILPRAGVRLVVLRPFNHIGPGQDERFVVPSLAGQIARIEARLVPPVLHVGNLTAARDFLPVGDVVRAYADVIDGIDGIESGSVFNIASGRPRKIESILDDLRRHATVPFDVQPVPERMRPSEIPTASGDSTRLRQALGWSPTEEWDATIESVLAEARAKVVAAGH